MEDSNKNLQVSRNAVVRSKSSKVSLAASSQGRIVHKASLLKYLQPREKVRSDVLFFLLKVAALEGLRRFSKARCPIIWRFLQTLQGLSCLPLKWIQRCTPLQTVVKGLKIFTRPLLFVSIASALSDHYEKDKENVNSDSSSDSVSCTSKAVSGPRSCEESADSVPENWLLQLYEELGKQGISLPERLNEDEIRRFHTAANRDLSCLISSIKKTISWREDYCMFSAEELQKWSHLVFWHGCDVMLRPCLIIRVGLACCSLRPRERIYIAQAVISQIEHGILHLINEDDPRITVLMDCEGLTPLRFPMNVLRSCSTIVQENYPNRLAKLFIIRLPPVVRVLAQTFIQVLRPSTRQKLCVEGETYQKALADFLQSVPAFLGGKCTCSYCEMLPPSKIKRQAAKIRTRIEPSACISNYDLVQVPPSAAEVAPTGDRDHILKTAILGILIVWIIITYTAWGYYSESLSSLLKTL